MVWYFFVSGTYNIFHSQNVLVMQVFRSAKNSIYLLLLWRWDVIVLFTSNKIKTMLLNSTLRTYVCLLFKVAVLHCYVWFLKSRSTKNHEVVCPKAIYIWSIQIFAVFFPVVFCCFFFKDSSFFFNFYPNHTAFWPQTSSFSVERDFTLYLQGEHSTMICKKGVILLKNTTQYTPLIVYCIHITIFIISYITDGSDILNRTGKVHIRGLKVLYNWSIQIFARFFQSDRTLGRQRRREFLFLYPWL